MSTLVNLLPEEVEALADWWAGKIGQGSEAESDRACKRIEQLHRLTDPARRFYIEQEQADEAPKWMGVDYAEGDDQTVIRLVRVPDWRSYSRELKPQPRCEPPTPSRFPKPRPW